MRKDFSITTIFKTFVCKQCKETLPMLEKARSCYDVQRLCKRCSNRKKRENKWSTNPATRQVKQKKKRRNKAREDFDKHADTAINKMSKWNGVSD